MHVMSRFAKKLNIQNCINSTKNCVHYTYEMSRFEEKLIVQSCANSMEIVYIIRTKCLQLQKNWMSKLRKFNGKLGIVYMYRMSGFAEKLNVQNAKIQREIVCNIYVRNVWISRKNWISRTPKIQPEIVYIIYVQNMWIFKKIEHPKLHKFDRKLCTLYLYKMFGFAKKLIVQNCANSAVNCVHQMYETFGFAEKLISQIA